MSEMRKRERSKRVLTTFAPAPRSIALTILILFTGFAFARATVIPSVCVVPNSRSGETTLLSDAAAGQPFIKIDRKNNTVPVDIRITISPGGANEESFNWANVSDTTEGNTYITRGDSTGSIRNLAKSHTAGETVLWSTDTTAIWSYNNTAASTVIIPKGVGSGNYFIPGRTVYSNEGQPAHFSPGIHTAFSFDFPSRDGLALTWNLNGGTATASKNAPPCGAITYQGRLSDAGAAANGQYDLQFTVFDALTGGAAQSESVAVEDVSVVNGIFTVQLNFGSAFYNNANARFMEIGVRAGTSTDAFTVLTPRQPITDAPFAVNAQYAANAANAAQLNGVAADKYVRNDGSGASLTNLNASNISSGTLNDARLSTNVALRNSANTFTGNQSIGGDLQINGNNTITGNLTTTGTITSGGNITTTGMITSGCRAGFTAIAGGRLCVSGMQTANTFLNAAETCKGMQSRVGGYLDAMLARSQIGFDYFNGQTQGWLADYIGDNVRGIWLLSGPPADFDGPPLNIYNGNAGNPPVLPYRCVY